MQNCPELLSALGNFCNGKFFEEVLELCLNKYVNAANAGIVCATCLLNDAAVMRILSLRHMKGM